MTTMMLHSCSDWFGRQINVSKRPVPPPLLLPVLLFVVLAKNLFYLCASDHTQRALIFDPFFICLVLAGFRSIPLRWVAATVVAELHQLFGRSQVRLGEGLLGALMLMMMMINIATWWRRTRRRRWCFCRHWNTTYPILNSVSWSLFLCFDLLLLLLLLSPNSIDLYGFGGCFFWLKWVMA